MRINVRHVAVGLLAVVLILILSGVGSLVAWRVGLAKDVDRQIAEIHAAGLPANGEEANSYYAAVPASENAALKMAEAFALMRNFDDARSNQVLSIVFSSRNGAVPSEQLNLIADYCAMNSDALARAAQAVKLPRSRYPIDLSWGAATLLPQLANLKQLARVAEFRTEIQPEHSAADITAIVGMARTLDNEPVLISKLVRFAMLTIGTRALERRLATAEMSETDLSQLASIFAGAGQTNQIANAFIGERAMYFRYFRMSMAEIKKLGDSGDDKSQSGPPWSGNQPAIFKVTGFFERDLRFYLQAMQTNVVLALAYPKNVGQISRVQAQISESSRRNYFILSSMLLPALGNSILKEANTLASLRCAQTGIAIERFRLAHGTLPQKLDELVPQFLPAMLQDPFDGQLLRYRHLENGYVIYSIGSDGEDNGGRERPADAKSSDKTHYDVTFIVER
jgi:hypothetical protein